MPIFEVYEHPVNKFRLSVKRGYSWPAFFAGAFWFLAKGLGLWALFWFALVFVLGSLTFAFLAIPIWVAAGFFANDTYRKHLLAQGYKHVATTSGLISSSGSPDPSPSTDAEVNNGTKKCPQCAETIKLEAIICRFCRYPFDPAHAQQQAEAMSPPSSASRGGDQSHPDDPDAHAWPGSDWRNDEPAPAFSVVAAPLTSAQQIAVTTIMTAGNPSMSSAQVEAAVGRSEVTVAQLLDEKAANALMIRLHDVGVLAHKRRDTSPCWECTREIPAEASSCPHCRVPSPAATSATDVVRESRVAGLRDASDTARSPACRGKDSSAVLTKVVTHRTYPPWMNTGAIVVSVVLVLVVIGSFISNQSPVLSSVPSERPEARNRSASGESTSRSGTPRQRHALMLAMSEQERRAWFTHVVQDERCGPVVRTFFQGFDSDGWPVWNIACEMGNALSVSINVNDPKGSTKVLDCTLLKAFGIQCFRKFQS